MVREAIESSIPMRLPAKERPRPTISPVAGFIDEILEDDRRAPRKQRHTAHRIWVRITRERSSHPIAESTVRQYVRQRKRTLGLRVAPEVFVPQQYAWGDEAQWIGTRRTLTWTASGSRSRCLRCAAWRAE